MMGGVEMFFWCCRLARARSFFCAALYRILCVHRLPDGHPRPHPQMGDYFSSYVRVVLMEHGGHFCHLEERAAFEALLFEFLAFPASLLRT